MKVRKTKTARDESEEKVFLLSRFPARQLNTHVPPVSAGIYRREIAGPTELESFVGAPAEPQNRPYIGTN